MHNVVIGLSTYQEEAAWGQWRIDAALIPAWYLDLFRSAGASIVLLPPGSEANVLDRLDGLVSIGGADVDARLYGAEPHPSADAPRELRDRTEIDLYRGACSRGIPFLGICRGAQIMAVAEGGSLHQHLPDITRTTHKDSPMVFIEHEATFEPDSLIATVMGTESMRVNSYHHQAIADPGKLRVTGRAEDGTVEVVENPRFPFCLGVQWHPEHPDRRSVDRPLIDGFLNACRVGD